MTRISLRSRPRLSPYAHLAVFFFLFFTTQTTGQYVQIYLYGIGLSKTRIGLITGTAGLVALVFQPLLGGLADASSSKKRLLGLVIGAAAAAFPVMYFGTSAGWIFLFYTLYHIFFSFAMTLNTSVSVEYCQQEGRPFGPLRMLGALSYSLMMLVIGSVTGKTVDTIFLIFPAACLLSLCFLAGIPDVRGGNSRNSGLARIPPTALLKDRTVMVLIAFQTLIGVATGISNGFFSIYFTDDMHGSAQLYSVCIAVAAMAEVPFLFLTDRWLDGMGYRRLLMLLCGLTALRNLLCFLASSVGMLMLARCMSCFSVMEGVTYSLILVRIVRPQLKTSAQTLSATVQNVANLMVSSYLGGFLADLVGIRPLFGVSAVLTAAICLIFTLVVFPRTIREESVR